MATEQHEYEVFQGDTGPILRVRPGLNSLGATEELGVDWHCYVAVNDFAGANVVARREVTDKTPDNLRWLAGLTPTETDTLDVEPNEAFRNYTQVIEVVNTTTTPPYNKEKHVVLKIKNQGTSAA